MADLIERRDALNMHFSHGINNDGVLYVPFREVMDNLKALPSAQPEIIRCGQCKYAEVADPEDSQWHHDVNAIKAVPSAQPEIIRCKDCKWYELPSHRIFENCVRWMESNGILLPIKPDDFCSRAERRIDG